MHYFAVGPWPRQIPRHKGKTRRESVLILIFCQARSARRWRARSLICLRNLVAQSAHSDAIIAGVDDLGLDLEEHIAFCIEAMKTVAH